MVLLAAIFAIAGLLWAAVVLLHRPDLPLGLPAWLTLLSFFASIVLGYFLWHRDLGPVPLTIDRALLGLAGVAWLYGCYAGQYRWPRWGVQDALVGLWVALPTLSTLFTDYGFRDNLPISRLLFFYLIPGATYFLLRLSPSGERHECGFLWLLVAVGLYLGLTGIAEWRRWNGLIFPRYIASPEFEEFYGRGRGPLLNPVINGMLMSLAGTACLVLLPLTKWRWWPGLLLAAGLIAGGVLSTLTRSCWMAFGASMFLVCLAPLTWRQRVVLTLFTGLAGAIGLAAVSSQLNRFKRDEFVTEAEMSQSAALRPVLALVAWEMIQDHPLTGVGLGQYNKFKKPYHQVEGYDLPLQSGLPYLQHNVMLSCATELGLTGLLAAAAMWLALGWQAVRLWSARDRPFRRRCLALVLFTALLNYLVNGLFHDVSIISGANLSLLVPAALVRRAEES